MYGAPLSTACAAHAGLGPSSLVLNDVSTQYSGTDAGTGSARVSSRVRCLEPQITIGAAHRPGPGFPPTVHAFERNMAGMRTMLGTFRKLG